MKKWILVSVLLLGACTGKDYAYEPASETPPGPGLFSGKDGVFTIYGDDTAGNLGEQPVNNQKGHVEKF